jgi:two-component system, OmpR family, alkaline phosphatase synthesis response regulator PhoP
VPALRVLIVDDDEPIRVMLTAIVRQQGFAVETARDGEEAIEKLKKGHFNVVLLDLMMPRVNGYDVLRYLASTQPELLRRTIVATAVPEREIKRKLTVPVFSVHHKPFELPTLIADLRIAAQS